MNLIVPSNTILPRDSINAYPDSGNDGSAPASLNLRIPDDLA